MNERKCGLEGVSRCVGTPVAGGGAGCNDILSLSSRGSYLEGTNNLRIRIAEIEFVL